MSESEQEMARPYLMQGLLLRSFKGRPALFYNTDTALLITDRWRERQNTQVS